MVSYAPLRKYLESNGRTIHYLRAKGVINSVAAKKLADDEPISLKVVARICIFLDLRIEQVVEVVKVNN